MGGSKDPSWCRCLKAKRDQFLDKGRKKFRRRPTCQACRTAGRRKVATTEQLPQEKKCNDCTQDQTHGKFCERHHLLRALASKKQNLQKKNKTRTRAQNTQIEETYTQKQKIDDKFGVVPLSTTTDKRVVYDGSDLIAADSVCNGKRPEHEFEVTQILKYFTHTPVRPIEHHTQMLKNIHTDFKRK